MSESVTVAGVTVPHNTKPWSVKTNRHPTTSGYSWGWVEGAPGNVCWSNDSAFNSAAAGQLVKEHNQWLEDQKPLSIRLIEAKERLALLERRHTNAAQAAERAKSEYLDAAGLVAELQQRAAATADAGEKHE